MNYGGTTSETSIGDNIIFRSILSPTVDRIEEAQIETGLPPSSISTAEGVEFPEIYPEELIEGSSYWKVKKVLLQSLEFVDNILQTEDEIERENILSLLRDNLESLWNLGKDLDKNFADVIVLLQVAIINSQYQNYSLQQYSIIKQILEKIKKIYILPDESSECMKLLLDNDIDIFAPIRNWEKYSIEIKEVE